MRNVMLMMLAVVATVCVSGQTFAGGSSGGAKKDSTITVTNKTSSIAAVILDNSNPPTVKAAFLKAGGQLLQPGKSYSFKVAGGTHLVGAQLVNPTTGAFVGSRIGVNRTVAKGKTLNLNVTGTTTAAISP